MVCIYSTFLVLMTTQCTVCLSPIHTHIHTVHLLAALFVLCGGNSAYRWGRLGIKLPTFWLANDRSTSQPQPPFYFMCFSNFITKSPPAPTSPLCSSSFSQLCSGCCCCSRPKGTFIFHQCTTWSMMMMTKGLVPLNLIFLIKSFECNIISQV